MVLVLNEIFVVEKTMIDRGVPCLSAGVDCFSALGLFGCLEVQSSAESVDAVRIDLFVGTRTVRR